jgi:hypothetical protein
VRETLPAPITTTYELALTGYTPRDQHPAAGVPGEAQPKQPAGNAGCP